MALCRDLAEILDIRHVYTCGLEEEKIDYEVAEMVTAKAYYEDLWVF